VETTTLICRLCHTENLLKDCSKDSSRKLGYKNLCKKCASVIASEYYTKNVVKIRTRITAYSHSYVPLKHRNILSRLKALCTHAKNRKKEIDIDWQYLEEIWNQQSGLCAYSGEPLVVQANFPNTVSLDRIDSSKGYLRGNVQLVCAAVNRMKQEFSEEMFLDYCEKITNNRRKTTQSI
jgi:hypothetical protein